jgi:SNF family Na+-dependent transporter
MPWSNLFSLLLFLLMFTLGLSTAIALVETTTANLREFIPNRNGLIALFVCFNGFVLSIPYTLNNGFYFLDLVDYYLSSYCLGIFFKK